VDADFRTGAAIGSRQLDHAFTGLSPDHDRRFTASLRDRTNGTGVRMSWGSWGRWVQLHTADGPKPETVSASRWNPCHAHPTPSTDPLARHFFIPASSSKPTGISATCRLERETARSDEDPGGAETPPAL
jgi:hypothetical protein